MKIESDNEMPPGGWRMVVPQTGIPVHAPYAKTLFKRVNDHLDANGIPRMERAEFEDLACRESGHGMPWCSGGPGVVKPPTTLQGIKRFLKTMAALARRRKLVDRAEQARRMAICEACPMNSVEGLGCHNCYGDLKDIEQQAGEKLPGGNVLSCQACLCLCWPKAWIDNRVLDEAEAGDRPAYHSDCWRLEG